MNTMRTPAKGQRHLFQKAINARLDHGLPIQVHWKKPTGVLSEWQRSDTALKKAIIKQQHCDNRHGGHQESHH